MKAQTTERLTTADEQGNRRWVYPADVQGRFRSWRGGVSWVLIAVFALLPWIRIGGEPALLMDGIHRRFVVLGVRFSSQDAPYLAGIALTAVVLIAWVTAVFGRAWCGWACPQTVFVEMVFRRIERWIEGDAVARRRLDQGPVTFDKVRKKTLKWLIFAFLSWALSHSFLAIFVGADAVSEWVSSSPLRNPGMFLAAAFLSLVVLFDFGWFREQFCTLVCPYGRFQSALLDDRSWVVAYDQRRGEPRRGKAPSATPVGDCVDCRRCVNVCPTGIDIRQGLQMECIACTSCIDACDAVMTRLGRPTGLIRYSAGTGADSSTRPVSLRHSLFRPRPLAYLAAAILIGGALSISIARRDDLLATFARAPGEPFQRLSGASADSALIVNTFFLDVENLGIRSATLALGLESPPAGSEIVLSGPEPTLEAGERRRVAVFFKLPESAFREGKRRLRVRVGGGASAIVREVTLVGPWSG